jgi:hypothetical protein
MVRIGQGTDERGCEGPSDQGGHYHPDSGKVNRRVVLEVTGRDYASKKLERPDSTQAVGSRKRNVNPHLWEVRGGAL